MIITYKWRGAGLIVLVVAPVMIALNLIVAVNFLGKDFVKDNFRTLVIFGIAIAGFVCSGLGRWLNRQEVVQEKSGAQQRVGVVVGDFHQMWGIPIQNWLWVYLVLALLVSLAWR